jgi:hypothetical protein
VSCDGCGKDYSSFSAYTGHFTAEGCSRVSQRADGLYTCQYCSATVSTLSGIKNHMSFAVSENSFLKYLMANF